MEMKAKIENGRWKKGSTAAPAVAIGALADGILGWFACVFQSSVQGRAEQHPGRARSPIHPRNDDGGVR
jgi:hypothetical protein